MSPTMYALTQAQKRADAILKIGYWMGADALFHAVWPSPELDEALAFWHEQKYRPGQPKRQRHRCKGCDGHLDDLTPGCENCRERHAIRAKRARAARD